MKQVCPAEFGVPYIDWFVDPPVDTDLYPHMTHIMHDERHSPHEAAVCGIGSMTFSPPKIGHHTDSLHPSKAIEIYLATLASKNNSQNQPHKADITSHSSKPLCWFNFGITFQRFVRHTTDQAAGLASRQRGVLYGLWLERPYGICPGQERHCAWVKDRN